MRLVCVANSWRPDGRCIAGIDVATRQFIRPVPASADAVPEERVIVEGRSLAIGDVLELELRDLPEPPRFQCENRLIVNWDWHVVGKVAKERLLNCCDDTAPILHNAQDRVLPALLEKLPPTSWRSLQLVRPRKLTFAKDSYDHHRWRARFQDKLKNEYVLPMTDPLATQKLEAGENIGDNVILLVSLTKPWMPLDASKIKLCYKLVATVIEL